MPPEPHPGASYDGQDRQQSYPPPVVCGERPESCGHSDPGGEIQHPAGAADLGSENAEQKPDDHCVGAELPDECVNQHHRQDNSHKYSTENVNHPPGA
jgi:hypothetical protein